MKIIHKAADWFEIEKENLGKTIGLVPTMGALHQGHKSLVDRSVKENDITIVSIFLNPVQFNNKEDLVTYPVSFENDCRLLEEAGATYLFAPEYDEMYPDDYHYKISEDDFSRTLCGASRPGHFDGVLTVVMKLLQIFYPTRAYFGEKDYQQYKLIDGMAKAFFLRTQIISCPIIREKTGLASSSRNRRLSSSALAKAPFFYKELSSGKSPEQIIICLENDGFKVDYIVKTEGRIYGAVYLEDVRLIDNVEC